MAADEFRGARFNHRDTLTRPRTALMVIAMLAAAAGTSGSAGQVRYLPDAPGTWKSWVFTAAASNRSRVAARPTDFKALEAQRLALNAIIRKTPGLSEPFGFSVETVGDLDLEAIDRQAIHAWLQ